MTRRIYVNSSKSPYTLRTDVALFGVVMSMCINKYSAISINLSLNEEL